ncbi:hypothetical protein NDK50_21590 [Paraburkholderia bryophila]|uniref:hypothetical protein n=1 Tax=Paraburkholderia bryophila TaxID=420952 RepID=UPI00234B4377|nr:hypothetical protein [Paraburkholderia bryophila]WCM23467.1 hypothetical protein NDK50_21590 [Paraburkholderia bryophila]
MADAQTTFNGSFDTQKKHRLPSALLDVAISDWEAIATKFGLDAIKDSATRAKYMAHIAEISNEVRQQVDSGNMSIKDGAVYCNQLRDKLFIEYRKYTSSIGVAQAEAIKLNARGFDYYLNKYSQIEFKRNFVDLTEQERGKIYYEVIKSAGRGNDTVNTNIRKLRVRGRVFLLVTAILAVGEIVGAKNKIKEVARQGSIIAGGMIGGGLAGFGVSFVCGPAEPLCAVALVYIGSHAGGTVGQLANDAYQDELVEFMRWMKR